MYLTLPSFVLGFHGCDREIGEAILAGKESPIASKNDYDWLGDGIYFWENSPERALSYAEMLVKKKNQTQGKIKDPFVIGAIINLGNCLNLTEEKALLEVKTAYDTIKKLSILGDTPMPVNKPGFNGDEDKIKRHLDRAVITVLHGMRETDGLPKFDSARSPFFEGLHLWSNENDNS